METPRKKRSLLGQYLAVELIWNPLLTAAIVLVQNRPRGFLRSFPLPLLIGAIVSTVCFGGTALVRLIEERWAARRGATAPTHSVGWYLALSALFMLPGLMLAFRAVNFVFDADIDFRLRDYQYGLLLGALVTSFFFLWQTRADAREAVRAAELRMKELERLQLQAQLGALTAQMNPHLLFNALNTVAALIKTDPDRAEEVIVRIADLYRGVLKASQRTTHPLADELALCRAYLDVEQARFADRLRVVIDVASELSPEQLEVPVLVLQPLVENAVKHGLAPRAAPGTVTIRGRLEGDRVELRVEDDGVGLDHPGRKGGAGMAIENTRQRLALDYKDEASLELVAAPAGGTHAVLRLPRAKAA